MSGPKGDEQLRDTFEHFLARAVFLGERDTATCTGLVMTTWSALRSVAELRTIESVQAACEAFEQQLIAPRESRAVRLAVKAGEIPIEASHQRWYDAGRPKELFPPYYPEMVSWGNADPEAAKAWLAANRDNPGAIYRSTVLDRG